MPTNNHFSFEQLPLQLSAGKALPEEILVLPVGNYKTYIGDIDITDELLSQIVSNFSQGIPHKELPIDERHNDGVAPGWIKKLSHRLGDGLYAAVDWTSYGSKLLTDKLYRYVSADFSTNYIDSTFGKEHGPVLSAVALTNRPMLQNIPALLSQEAGQDKTKHTQPISIMFSQEGESMNLDQIRAKSPADLSDEEKAFLTEHSADLTAEERTSFGIAEGEQAQSEAAQEDSGAAGADTEAQQDGEGDQPTAQPGQEAQLTQNGVKLSQAQYDALVKSANEGSKALAMLNRAQVEKEAEHFVFSQSNQDGAFLPKSQKKLGDFMFSLNAGQRKAFTELMADMPKGIHQLTQEVGDGGQSNGSGSQLFQLTQAKVDAAAKAGQTLAYDQALSEVSREHPELVADSYGVEGGN